MRRSWSNCVKDRQNIVPSLELSVSEGHLPSLPFLSLGPQILLPSRAAPAVVLPTTPSPLHPSSFTIFLLTNTSGQMTALPTTTTKAALKTFGGGRRTEDRRGRRRAKTEATCSLGRDAPRHPLGNEAKTMMMMIMKTLLPGIAGWRRCRSFKCRQVRQRGELI